MEEDLKILEKGIYYFNKAQELLIKKQDGFEVRDINFMKALENLLTRYKQLEAYYKCERNLFDDYIPVSKVEEQIKWLDNDIKNTKYKLEHGKTYPNYIGEHRRLRMKAFITKSKEIKERLQDLIGKETD